MGTNVSRIDTERIAKLEIQVEAIKEDVMEVKGDIKELHSRITTGNREIVEKIEAMDHRLENKLNASAEAAKEQHHEIQIEIQKDIKEVSGRVDVLERWKWIVVGGAIVIGYIIGNIDFFSKFFN
jgi:predicted  nucleic acid-binding Zn-ribbon protein